MLPWSGTDSARRKTPADTLARQLIRRQILTPYQAKLLLNGRAGPFRYGEYLLQQRLSTGRLRGAFRAIHQPSRFPVQLKFAPQQVVRDQRQWNAARHFVHSECSVVSDQLQRVYSLEEQAGYRFLILEPLSGLSAAEQLVAGKLTAMESCRVVRLVALGLATLHQQRQVYGNVEPNHIWLESSGHVKLLRDRFLPPTVPAPWQAEQSKDVALPVVFFSARVKSSRHAVKPGN